MAGAVEGSDISPVAKYDVSSCCIGKFFVAMVAKHPRASSFDPGTQSGSLSRGGDSTALHRGEAVT